MTISTEPVKPAQMDMPKVIACESTVWSESKAEGARLLTLLAIARYCDPTGGGAFMKIGSLARMTRTSVRNVRYHLASLEDSGELICYGIHESGNSMYAIALPSLEHRIPLMKTFTARKRSDRDKGQKLEAPADTTAADTDHREPLFPEEESFSPGSEELFRNTWQLGDVAAAETGSILPEGGPETAESFRLPGENDSPSGNNGSQAAGTIVPTTPYIDQVNTDRVNSNDPPLPPQGEQQDALAALNGADLSEPFRAEPPEVEPRRSGGNRKRKDATATTLANGKPLPSQGLVELFSGGQVDINQLDDNPEAATAPTTAPGAPKRSAARKDTSKGGNAALAPGSAAELALLDPGASKAERPAGKFTPADQEDFDAFWSIYPVKIGKKDCLGWWKRRLPRGTLFARIMLQVEAYKASNPEIAAGSVPPTKHPHTWLNGEHWEDVYKANGNGRHTTQVDVSQYRPAEVIDPPAPAQQPDSPEKAARELLAAVSAELGFRQEDQPRYWAMVERLRLQQDMRGTMFYPPESDTPAVICFLDENKARAFRASAGTGKKARLALTQEIISDYRPKNPNPHIFTASEMRDLMRVNDADTDSAGVGA